MAAVVGICFEVCTDLWIRGCALCIARLGALAFAVYTLCSDGTGIIASTAVIYIGLDIDAFEGGADLAGLLISGAGSFALSVDADFPLGTLYPASTAVIGVRIGIYADHSPVDITGLLVYGAGALSSFTVCSNGAGFIAASAVEGVCI